MPSQPRDSRGRFTSGGPRRRGIGGRVAKGAIPFDSQKRAVRFVHQLFASHPVTKRQAERLFRMRGGSKRFFERLWKDSKNHPGLREGRKESLRGIANYAKRRGFDVRKFRAAQAKGMYRYWLGESRYDAIIAEYYGERPRSREGPTPIPGVVDAR